MRSPRSPLLVLAILFTAFFVMVSTATAQHEHAADEEAAIRQAVDHYLQGHATGDGSHFRVVFHPESKLFWMRNGELNQRTSEAFIGGASGKPAKDEAQRKRRIAMVDVTGSAAVVKVELDYPSAMITDYFAMLKVDGDWKIMNKIFHVESRGDR
ncbi:MAG: nuclear transport factor 2 family protein [Rhodothermales bacterium]|nr:nuclear transport factor 2 family protein [Rhodothermales bacterium]